MTAFWNRVTGARLALVPAFAALLALLLALPGRSYVGRYAADMIGFIDAADRTLKGQVANVEYSNVLGPLGTLLLAAGAWLGGSWGSMAPIASAIALLCITPLLLHVMVTRLSPAIGLLVAVLILVLVAAPITLGDAPRMTTFAMFYNRWGWAILSLVFLMILPARSKWDAGALALAVVALFYLKVTFAAVAIGFLGACAVLLPDMRRTALIALAASVAVIAAVELLWGGTAGYFNDLRNAAAQSGALRGGLRAFVGNALLNVTDLLLFALMLVLAACRGVKPVYLLFGVGMALSGVLLIMQAAQHGAIVTVVPAALVVMLAPAQRPAERAEKLTIAVLVLSFIATPAIALGWHVIGASKPMNDPRMEIDGIVIASSDGQVAIERVEQAYGGRRIETNDMLSLAVDGFAEADRLYFRTIHEGVELIEKHAPRGKIMTLDMSNPFNALLGRQPPRGTNVALVSARTIGQSRHPDGTELLGDTDIVMIPSFPRNPQTAALLLQLYGPFLRDEFGEVARSRYWTLLVRKPDRPRS